MGMTPTSCVAPTYSAVAVSYRIEKSCSPLSKEKQHFKRQLNSCTRPKVEKVKVSQTIKSKMGKCTEMKHSSIWQGERFCISQVPVVECGMGCGPRSIVNKTFLSPVFLPPTRELSSFTLKRSDV